MVNNMCNIENKIFYLFEKVFKLIFKKSILLKNAGAIFRDILFILIYLFLISNK